MTFLKRVLRCQIYPTSSFTHILLTQNGCNHLENKRNYTVYKTETVKSAREQLTVDQLYFLCHTSPLLFFRLKYKPL